MHPTSSTTTIVPPEPRRGWVLAVCCSAQFLTLLDVTVVNVALPSIRADLGFTPAGLAWVVNAYTLALAGFLLLGGRAADLLGRREVFAGGLALLGVASLAGGLAQDATMLVAARAGQGIGGAMVAPAGLSILTTTFAEGPQRNRALAWWGTLGGLGGASGALVGGALTEALSWRWVLLVGTPFAVAVALAALRVVPRLGRSSRAGARFDLPGALSVTAGLVLVTAGILATERHGLAAAATLGPLLGGCVLLGVFLLIEGRLAEVPLVPLRVLRSRGLAGASAVVLCLGAVAFALWFLLTLHLQQVLGRTALQAGLAFVPMSLTIVVATRAASRLVDAFGPGLVMAGGMGTLGTGMLLLAGAGAEATSRDLLVPTLLCAAGIGASFVPAAIAATSGVAHADSGLASGVLNTAYQVGSSLGLALLAAIAAGSSPQDGFGRAYLAGAVLAWAGAGVALLVLVRPGRRAPTRAAARSW